MELDDKDRASREEKSKMNGKILFVVKQEPSDHISDQTNNDSKFPSPLSPALNTDSQDSELVLNVMHVHSSELQVVEDLGNEPIARNDSQKKDAESSPNTSSGATATDAKQVVNKTFICSVCNLQVESLNGFYYHLNTHCSANSCMCPLCKKVLKTKSSFSKHLKNHAHNYYHTEIPTIDVVEQESESIGVEEDEEFILTSLKSTDRRHCKYCNKVFRRRVHLECHERIHTGDKPYKCAQCDKSFARKDGLRLHQHLHSGVRPYKCTRCDKAFPRQSSLKEHERIHVGVRSYRCKECEKTFLTDAHLRAHERTHTGEKPYNCERCNMSFMRKTDLKRHEVSHKGSKPYRCSYCDKGFTRQNDLKRHEVIHKITDKPEKCDDYGNAFAVDSDECAATSIKSHRCKHCDRAFTRRSDRKRHEHTHTGIKPFKCRYCEKAFTRQNDVKRHEIIHSRDKPYKCRYCDKAYIRQSYVLEHESIHTDVLS